MLINSRTDKYAILYSKENEWPTAIYNTADDSYKLSKMLSEINDTQMSKGSHKYRLNYPKNVLKEKKRAHELKRTKRRAEEQKFRWKNKKMRPRL